jgi:tRNA pseudouridine55 synthase
LIGLFLSPYRRGENSIHDQRAFHGLRSHCRRPGRPQRRDRQRRRRQYGARAPGARRPSRRASPARQDPGPGRLIPLPDALHGWLVVDKAVGIGSTSVVGAVKRLLREGGYPRVKVGHGGTLDPLASGVLPIALGEATKLSGHMLDADKFYRFVIAFGAETDSLDAEGAVVATCDSIPDRAAFERVLPAFTGAIDQVPPAFSALKVDGRRAYALARAGEEVKLAPRRVEIRSLRLVDWREGAATLEAMVSKGTYVRSLARDLARAAGSVGHVVDLRRLRAGPFAIETAISLDKLGELAKARALEQAILPLAAGLDDIPALPVTPDQARALRQGREAVGAVTRPGLYLATDQSVPVALVKAEPGSGLRVVRGFNLT